MWIARRGSLIGLLFWPGALFYVLYTYAFYLIGVPFNALFLSYVALVALSAYTMIGIGEICFTLLAFFVRDAARRQRTASLSAKVSGSTSDVLIHRVFLPDKLVSVFIIGVTNGCYCVRQRTLVPPIIAHAVMNLWSLASSSFPN